MPGAGSQRAGATPAGGYYTQPSLPSPVVYPDPQTGQSDSGRLIDQRSRQFVSTADGRYEGMSSVQQIVQIAWSTIDASSIGPFDGGYANRARAAYLGTSAIQNLINLKMLQILDFTPVRFGSNGLRTKIRFRDLTTNVEHTTTL